MNRMTPAEQLDNYRITCEVAADARSTREEFRQLDAEIARLKRENADLQHHYKHHREAGERLHTQYCELREVLERIAGNSWSAPAIDSESANTYAQVVAEMQRIAREAVGEPETE